MQIVAGIDFGTLNVRVSIFEKSAGCLGSATAEYPLHRRADDPDYATQSEGDHIAALESATRQALRVSGISGENVDALAMDTTGSSVVPVGEGLEPLSEYYLWCDHRAWREAEEITLAAREQHLEALDWCGGTYSSEWGFSKLLHWLRHNPDKRGEFVTALEHCDLITAKLCGIAEPDEIPRSICAMGHKWMWNPRWGGLPSQEFLTRVDPLFDGIRAKMAGRYSTSDQLAGRLSEFWAQRLGLKHGLAIPVSGFDAHWDAVGANIRLGDVVNVIGTSTCIIAISEQERLVPGVCGVVPGSVKPKYVGIEAGLSAVGDIFERIAARAGTTVSALSVGLEKYRAGQTGLLRFSWDNGDRTVLVNPSLGGITLGWSLVTTAQDELFAAIEGTAFHTRIILERMQEYGTPVARVIHGGGIPQRGDVLNQVYANILDKPVMVPQGAVAGLGSAIFAFLASGAFKTLEEAQDALCRSFRTFLPEPRQAAIYEEMFKIYRDLYFAFGRPDAPAARVGHALPALRALRDQVRGAAN